METLTVGDRVREETWIRVKFVFILNCLIKIKITILMLFCI